MLVRSGKTQFNSATQLLVIRGVPLFANLCNISSLFLRSREANLIIALITTARVNLIMVEHFTKYSKMDRRQSRNHCTFRQIQSNSVITNSSGPAIFVCYNRGSL